LKKISKSRSAKISRKTEDGVDDLQYAAKKLHKQLKKAYKELLAVVHLPSSDERFTTASSNVSNLTQRIAYIEAQIEALLNPNMVEYPPKTADSVVYGEGGLPIRSF
jgi:hypothetical protein